MKSFKYTINGNVYKVHINSVVDDIAEVEVNGTPYNVKMEKPAKKQMVTLKRPAQAPTTACEERTNFTYPRGYEDGKQHQR